MKKINIDGFEVGGDKAFIIADVGSNHMQDIELAKESIDLAAKAGANAVKFQSIKLSELYLNPNKKVSKFINKLEFPENWHYELKKYAEKVGITFFSSPTYLKAVEILEDIDVSLYKLASAQVGTFPQIVDKIASLKKPIIFSTGLTTIDQIDQTVNNLKKFNNNKFIILHCNSIYPTPAKKVNLNLIKQLSSIYSNPIGFSDHTIGTHTCCAAIALGAKVIEKHFTLDRGFNSPDSNAFASDPKELNQLVKQIREVEQSLNSFSGRDKIEKEEQNFKNSISYKLVAATVIEKGTKLNSKMLKYLRSDKGINCIDEKKIVGKKANYRILENELIEYEKISK
jgi:sialic acid synthase SpsE